MKIQELFKNSVVLVPIKNNKTKYCEICKELGKKEEALYTVEGTNCCIPHGLQLAKKSVSLKETMEKDNWSQSILTYIYRKLFKL